MKHKFGIIAVLGVILPLAIAGPQATNSASATGALTSGVSGPVTITATVPALNVWPDGSPYDSGTASGQYQILGMYVQLVLKTASASAYPSWYWDGSDAATFVNSSASPSYCIGAYSCQRSGLFELAVSRSGSPVTFTPSYFSGSTIRISVDLSATDSPAVGTVGLQTGDQVSFSLKDGFLSFPDNLDDYEFRFVYRGVQIGTGAHGPLGYAATTSSALTTLSTPSAPTAAALAGSARVTPAAASPTPASCLITASPQVGGVTKTCTVTPPATACTVNGLTAGTNYTFTTKVNPLGGIASGASADSEPVTPFLAPTISAVSPNVGPTSGGTLITITGTNFSAGAVVTINGFNCPSVTVVSDTEITCIAAASAAGANKWVRVANTNGGDAYKFNAYSYVVPPTVSAVSPTSGSEAGGTSITITGTGFMPTGLSVTVGGNACTVTASTATSITCMVPAGTETAAADIVITNADTGTAMSAGAFMYEALEEPTPGGDNGSGLPAGLAFTGSELFAPVGGAAGALLIGLALVIIRRKDGLPARRSSHRSLAGAGNAK